MTEPFFLAVNHKGVEFEFTTQLVLQAYTYKFKVLIGKLEVYFEPDEEGSYRAVGGPGQDQHKLVKIDKELLSEIGLQLENIRK